MFRIKIIFTLFFVIGCSIDHSLIRGDTEKFIRLCNEVIEESLLDHVTIDRSQTILLVSQKGNQLAFLVWNKKGLNELLALLDISLKGYISNASNDFILVNTIKGVFMKPIQDLPYFDEEKVKVYKEQLNWTAESGTPPPPPPLNVNPFIYYYKVNKDKFIELSKGNNLEFPLQ